MSARFTRVAPNLADLYPAIGTALRAGGISEAELRQVERQQRNVIVEARMVLRAHKPGRGKACPPALN